MIKYFNKCFANKKKGKSAIEKEHNFVIWVHGLDTFPYYKFCLVGLKKIKDNNIKKVLSKSNTFLTKQFNYC